MLNEHKRNENERFETMFLVAVSVQMGRACVPAK